MNDDVLKKSQELRCFCSRHPLLARYGVDESGELYVHMKIWKQRKIFGEFLFKSGTVSIKCRECLRWHNISIKNGKPEMRVVPLPRELQNSVSSSVEVATAKV